MGACGAGQLRGEGGYGVAAAAWWKLSGVETGQDAEGGREQVFHEGWELGEMVWV